MLQFLQSGSLTVLGQALFNSIWQMGLLWLLYLLLTGNQKRFSATTRHDLALVLCGSGSSWFAYTLFVPATYTAHIGDRLPIPFISQPAQPGAFFPAFSLVYLVALVYFAIRYLTGFLRLRAAQRSAHPFFPEYLQSFTDRILPAMGIRKPVKVILAGWTDTAQTVGFLKPLIILPVALVNRLSMEQVETILLHELHHIRRHDYLIHLGMMAFRSLFFFNPFAHFFFRAVSRERELACDDQVLRWNYPVPVYAEALFALEKFRQRSGGFSLAADGNNPRLLADRIRRLTGTSGPGRNPFSPALSFSLLAAFFIFIVNSVSFYGADADQATRTRLAGLNGLSYPVAESTVTDIHSLPRVQVTLKIRTATRKWVSLRSVTRVSSGNERLKPAPAIALPVAMVIRPGEQMILQQQLQYAGQTELRNYSNEKATTEELPVVINLAGTPYVPTSSFSYSVAADTLPDALLQNKIKAAMALSKMASDQAQAAIRNEIADKKIDLQQLKQQIEKTERQQREEARPLMEKARREILLKQKEILQLQKQLTREIIFI